MVQVNKNDKKPIMTTKGVSDLIPGKTLVRWMVSVLFIFYLAPHCAWAHPHSFVECSVAFVMDQKGLAGFRQQWVLDEMTTVAVLDAIGRHHGGALTSREREEVRNLSAKSLKAFHYFTSVRINGADFPVNAVADFSAELKDDKLIYEFLVPCAVPAVPGKPQQVEMAVYDESFYSYVNYATDDGCGIDPSKDKLFANPQAPARPSDFKRFAKAVGIRKYDGPIHITGDEGHFKITASIKDAPEMAYFYNQIIPQAFTIEFEPR
jgi:ABC-type uncharacterized transport system substrate-binding protein